MKIIFLMILATVGLSATVLQNDTFGSGMDGWSESYHWSSYLIVKKNKKSKKIYNFGGANANKDVKITLRVQGYGGWETSGNAKDYFIFFVNNKQVIKQSLKNNKWYTFSVNATLGTDGTIELDIKPKTTSKKEKLKVDYVTIETIGNPSNPDIGIGVTDNGDPAEVNSQVIYTLNVTNTNASANDVKITAQITSGSVTFDSTNLPAGWSVTNSGTTVVLTASSLPVGYDENLQIIYNTSSDTTQITFNATIESTSQTDDDTSNNAASETTDVIDVVEGASDICHNDIESSCINFGGVCTVGMGCRNTIPLSNIGNGNLSNVHIYYDESGIGGSYGSKCGVTPSGSCSSVSNIDFGSLGILGQATEFVFANDITQSDTSSAVWAQNFISGGCFGQEKFYVVYDKNGKRYKGELKQCNATTPPPDEPTVEQCGVFPSALNAFGSINTPACTNNHDTVINASSILANTVSPTDSNGNSCLTCDGSVCQVDTPPLERLTFPSFLYSDYKNLSESVTADRTFTQQHIKSLTIDGNNLTLHFAPITTYANTQTKLMRIGAITQSMNNTVYEFDAGDYYIDSWNTGGNGVTIKTNGKVRLFVKGNLVFDTNDLKINSGGSAGDMYIFGYSDISFPNSGGSQYDVNAYIYAKGNFSSSDDSSTSQFTGAITAEGDINLGNNQTFTFDGVSASSSGLGACVVIHEGDREFDLVNNEFSQNILGDVRTIGNTVLCVTTGRYDFGNCETGSSDATDNERYVQYINVEKEIDGRDTITVDGVTKTVYNSSAATLQITPSVVTAIPEVVWAGLFWQGSLHAWSYGSSGDDSYLFDQQLRYNVDSVYLDNVDTYKQDVVYLHFPNMADGEYTAVKVQQNGFYDYYNVYRDDYGGYTRNGGVYSCFADITELFKRKGDIHNPNGEYRVANLKTMKGREGNLGNYGGWSLVVIYDNRYDPNEKFRNISVYSGYKVISARHNTQTHIDIAGFRTPKGGTIDSTLSVFAGEAERYSGDYSELVTPLGTFDLDDGLTSSNNLYQGKISLPTGSTRTRDYPNTDGIDVRNFDVGNFMDHEQSSARINIGTSGDTYFPSMVTFATQLYKPDLCYDYAVKHRGHFLDVDLPDGDIPRLNLQVSPGTPLEFNIYIRNRESDIAATVLSLHTDFNTDQTSGPTQMEYIPNSVYLSRVNGNLYTPYLDSSALIEVAADKSSVRVGLGDNPINAYEGGSLGGNDYQYIRFSTNPKVSHIDMPFKLYLDMKLRFNDNNEITLRNFRLGADIKRCEPSTSYNPEWGIFTLIDYELNKNYTSPDQFYYNLRSQVVKKPFSLDIVALKESKVHTNPYLRNYWEPIDVNTTVEVEMADLQEFHDLNATCSDSFNSIAGTQLFLKFNGEWRKTLADQVLSYANKNATYRIWFLTDSNSSLIENQCGNGYDSNNASCYKLLYDEHYGSTHACDSECGSNPTQDCYLCLRGNFAKALCSRDNFSIRPEAFDMHLLDSNGSNEIPRGSNIVAEYIYDLDVNATTWEGDEPSNGYHTSLNSAFTWDPQTAVTCADEENKTFSISFYNGEAITSIGANNVGDYNITLQDRTWTSVDGNVSYLAHHSGAYSDYFLQNSSSDPEAFYDCKRDSSVVPTDPERLNGCVISSDHENLHTTKTYSSYDLHLLPYRFDLSGMAASIGLNDEAVGSDSFVYMADIVADNDGDGIADDLNMSYHLYGTVKAVGYGGTVLSNFTNGCFAQDIDLNLVNDYNGSTAMAYYLGSMDANNTAISVSDNNGTVQNDDNDMLTKKAVFDYTNAGMAKIYLRYNVKRTKNNALNPFKVTFGDLNASFHTATGNIYLNDGATYQIGGGKAFNNPIIFYYAKANVPRSVIKGNSGVVKGYYEIYCNTNEGCDKTLLPASASNSDDPRWWINPSHTSSYGKMKDIVQKNATDVNCTTTPSGNATESLTLTYDEAKGYPYKTTMKIVPDHWLIYNKFDGGADHNEFDVKFESTGGGWAGQDESNSSTKTSTANKNRILQW